MRGDIVCRFDEEHYSMNNRANSYNLNAYMCRNEITKAAMSVKNIDWQARIQDAFPAIHTEESGNFEYFPDATAQTNNQDVRLLNYLGIQGTCSGQLWNDQYAYRAANGPEDDYSSQDGSIDLNINGVLSYWIPIQATPILTTERVYTPYQECIETSNYDSSNTRRREMAITAAGDFYDFSDYSSTTADYAIKANIAHLRDNGFLYQPVFLTPSIWDHMDSATDGVTANSADPELCYTTTSRLYMMDQMSFTSVPNYDLLCLSDDASDMTVKYDHALD